MKNISKEIVAEIKKGQIVPESRFKLRWKSYLFWLLMSIMILFGALSLLLAILNVADEDPRFLLQLGLGKFLFLYFITAPFLWILLFLGALLFGVLAFRKTAKGYRRSTLFITSLIVLLISFLGAIGHILRIDHQMSGMISRNAPPFFRGIASPREGRWMRPGDGLIGGEIIGMEKDSFTLRSFSGEEWKIIFDEKTERSGAKELVAGEKIGIIGEKTGEFVMHALSMRSFPSDWNVEPSRGLMPPLGQDGQFPNGFPPPPPF
ncbi:MAG: hypothetical protein WC848_04145 [Parcubacteria group bacterium]|jgi:hypothetical protein